MTPNDDTQDEKLLARYRQASAADAAGPSDAVREAILAESRRVADELAKQAPPRPFDVSRPAANDSRWKITAFGTAGAALLAALLFAPRYWENAPPAQMSAVSSAPAPAATQAQDRAEQPKFEEMKPHAAPSNAAAARQLPSDARSVEGVAAQADRKSSKTSSLNPPVPATAPPLSAARNYAPVSPSAVPLAAAPPAPAARFRTLDPLARAAESAAPSTGAERASRADSAQKPVTLQSAVAQGDVARAALLLDQGAVIDARDEAGRTPLMIAVTQDRLEIVRLLLARGADPNTADNAGHTPMQQAMKRNLQDIAALLEQAGAH